MRWYELLTAPTGEPVWRENTPDEDRAIFTVTEVIRPRLLLVAKHWDGGEVILTVLYHTVERAFHSHLRYRSPDGHKTEPRRNGWIAVEDEAALGERLTNITDRFDQVAQAIGAQVLCIDFPAGASDEKLLEIFRSSDLFEMIDISKP